MKNNRATAHDFSHAEGHIFTAMTHMELAYNIIKSAKEREAKRQRKEDGEKRT